LLPASAGGLTLPLPPPPLLLLLLLPLALVLALALLPPRSRVPSPRLLPPPPLLLLLLLRVALLPLPARLLLVLRCAPGAGACGQGLRWPSPEPEGGASSTSDR
jgi:hypothetical protein